VYLTWSGWHYTGQNYGIASIFLRRRGLEMSGLERRLLHASFTLSYCVVFLVMHGESTQVGDPHREVRLVVLGIPDLVNRVAVPVVIFACFASTVAWVSMLGRRASHLADLAPALLISATQALWWSIPYAANHFELARGVVPISWDLRSLFFPWIAGAHALQYLWITSFYARASGRWSGQLRYYLAVLTAGSAAWALPALAFAPGRDAFDWNFALLLAATVNIHHFILDGAIWRLRHLKVARVLLSNTGADDTGEVIGGPVRKLVWAIALVGLIGTAHPLVEQFIVMPAESRAQDLPAVAASLDRQAWHGKTKAFSRFKLGMAFARAGKPQAAAAQFELSADMEPRVESIKRLIAHYQGAGDAEGFVRSCDRLFELPSVERTMPTPTPDTFGNAMPAAFSEACVSAARRAHPTPPNAGSRTGGGGQDGGI
jgi:hypothetical protein